MFPKCYHGATFECDRSERLAPNQSSLMDSHHTTTRVLLSWLRSMHLDSPCARHVFQSKNQHAFVAPTCVFRTLLGLNFSTVRQISVRENTCRRCSIDLQLQTHVQESLSIVNFPADLRRVLHVLSRSVGEVQNES